jgi:hypothetical protein
VQVERDAQALGAREDARSLLDRARDGSAGAIGLRRAERLRDLAVCLDREAR